ncbi:MAG: acetyltransferase [Pseudarcicella sp.]|jgi:sugar O-acyltransferase (sialic acid O-acetyltransferase NeuD family)|nr:acetyltransferase [Pseudarcicella sp.]MBP6409847.1 acetyltransferase [Pseudarcicella sp.]
MENPVIIFGAGSMGAVALDIFRLNNVIAYCFLDDDKKTHQTEIEDVVVMGSTDDEGFTKLIGQKCEAFVAIDDKKVRKNIVEMLHEKRKTQPVNAVHPNTTIAESSSIGHGNLISAGAIIGARATIGNHCMLHNNVVIEADVKVGDFVQIGAGAIVGASTQIAENVFIGSGAVIVGNISIGKGARIGAGSVVVNNIEARDTVFGNPATSIG